MNINRALSTVIAFLLFPVLAYAQDQPSNEEGSILVGLFWTILPIAIIIPAFLLGIRWIQRPILQRTRQHMERQVLHMERVEQSLDRIIKAIESKD